MKNKKIIIVDDEPMTRMDIRGILEAKGYNVVGEANDGFSAIEVCTELKPDLVIMDIDMPEFDGIKASKVITKKNLAGGIVFLTARDEDEYLENAKKIGVFNYILKPINEKAFVKAIDISLSKVSEFTELKKNLEDVNNKLNERKIIEKAKGILIKENGISEDEAYKKIRKLCMDKRTSMAEIAKVIVLGYED